MFVAVGVMISAVVTGFVDAVGACVVVMIVVVEIVGGMAVEVLQDP